MGLRKDTPCENMECPYDAVYFNDCEWYCGEKGEENEEEFSD